MIGLLIGGDVVFEIYQDAWSLKSISKLDMDLNLADVAINLGLDDWFYVVSNLAHS